MGNLIDKAERKFGRFAINGLMRYVVIIELIGAMIGMINVNIYYQYLALDYSAVFKGQIWRLFTFILCPEISGVDIINILLFAIMVYLYYWIGNSVEYAWGAFKFNLFYISGIILSVLAGLVLYLVTGFPILLSGFEYINMSLFLAFACINPDQKLYVYFLIPIKIKWLAILDVVFLGIEIISNLMTFSLSGVANALVIIIAMANFFVYFIVYKGRPAINQSRRKAEFKKKMGPTVAPPFRHRCAVCGRTEVDNPQLEFRYCSRCNGNYEYCSEHIYTHIHVE